MPLSPRLDLKPRKKPRQARSQATVDAIYRATIQILLSDGLQHLTTIRVAERAGASVGTLYQYFPHKQALLFAVLHRHHLKVEQTLTKAAAASHHKPLATMMAAVIDAFLQAKTGRLDEARAMYGIVAELNSREAVREYESRCRAALVAMLKTATDAKFRDLESVVFMLIAALSGPVRAVVEGSGPAKIVRALPAQLLSLCLGYLEQVKRNGVIELQPSQKVARVSK